MKTQKSDWYEAFRGNKHYLPGSHGEGVKVVQQVLVPLQAQIALISGRFAGDLVALQFYIDIVDTITCEWCHQPLERSGSGHSVDCDLYRKASEALTTDESECERSLLLDEQERLEARLNRVNRQLTRMVDARKSQ